MKNIVGQRFGRLLVTFQWLERSGLSRQSKCHCNCDCGNKVKVWSSDLKRIARGTKSCGCLIKEMLTTHGMRYTRENNIWKGMIQRCTNNNNPSFKNYGGRGITVCDRWRESFQSFFDDIGKIPKWMQIDRGDNNQGYFPSNVRIVSLAENSRNKRRSKRWFGDDLVFESSQSGADFFGVCDDTFRYWCQGRKTTHGFRPSKPGFRSELKYPRQEVA